MQIQPGLFGHISLVEIVLFASIIFEFDSFVQIQPGMFGQVELSLELLYANAIAPTKRSIVAPVKIIFLIFIL